MFGVFTHEYCKIVPQLQYISGKDYLRNQRFKTPPTQLLLFNYIISVMWHECVGPILLTQKSLQTNYIHLIPNLPG